MYLVWYGVERFLVEALRSDSLLLPGTSLKISQLIAAITAIIGMSLLIKFKNKASYI